jgi:hypothetical protein
MSRPTIERVEDNLITWRDAIYELHREIDKLDQEIEIMAAQLGHPKLVADLNPESLETVEIEIRRSSDRLGR